VFFGVLKCALWHLVQPAMPKDYGFEGFIREYLPIIPATSILKPCQIKGCNGYGDMTSHAVSRHFNLFILVCFVLYSFKDKNKALFYNVQQKYSEYQHILWYNAHI
jgi:hypothetical protein